jgi:PAS domain S-box-containing protein
METKILIVEQDPSVIRSIQNELKKDNIRWIMKIVSSEKKYEMALRTFKPDLILSTYNSSSFGGMAVFKLKKSLAPQTPFIFVLKTIDIEDALKLIKIGVNDLLLIDNLSTLQDKVNYALKETKQNILNQSENNRTKEFRQNEAKFKALFDNSIDGILLTVTDGQILAANPAACAIFQMTEREIIEAGRYGIVDLSDPRLKKLLDERQQKGRVTGELTLLHKDGSKFPGELTSAVYKDSNGEERTSIIVRDITKSKFAEEKINNTTNSLQQALSDLSKILDFSLDLICSFDEEGRFVRMNKASESILGYKPEELVGKKYMDFIFQDDAENTIKADIDVRSGVQLTLFENRFIHKSGSIIPLLWSAVWDDEYKLSYCIGKDTTDRKNLEKAFEIERQRFHDLYSQAPSCMGILKGPNHVYELANELYLQLIDKKDIIGKTVKEVLPELEEQGIFEFLDTVYKTGETFSANEMLVKFDYHGTGKLVDTYLNFIYQAHRDTDNHVDGILFFGNDVTEQVLSRKKIEEREKQYRDLIHNLPIATYSCDAEGRIILYNKAAVALWGREPEIGKDLWCGSWNIYNKKNLPITIDLCPMALALKEGVPILGEEIIIERPNGDKRNVFPHPVPFLDACGRVTGAVNVLADITETKLAQKSLKKSEKKYRLLFDNNPMPMWVIDLITFKFLDVNKMAILHYGYSREEFLSMTALDIRPEEDKDHFIKSSDTSEINKTNYNRGKWNHLKKDGNIIPVEIIAHKIIYEGVPARLILSHDITDRKKAELNLELRNKELADYRFALDESSIVGITDRKGKIIYANDNFCKISKYNREELIGQDHRIISSGYHPKEYIRNLWKTIATGKTWKGELKNKAKDGTFYWVDTTITPFLDEQGEPYQYVATRFDITNRKKAEINLEKQNKELIKANSELDRFVYSVSHDLRSPLTSILGVLSFIEEESQEPDTLEHAEMIHKSIDRLDEFIKNILSYSRNNRTGLEIEKIPIQEKIVAIVERFHSMKEAKEIHFEIDIKEQQPFYTDRLRFKTILENLISNAIKHHKEEIFGRYIKITGQSDRQKLQLIIADNGIGIDPVYHQKIFDMFFRLSGKKDGSGIGLYIVKETIELLQGSIEIQSSKGAGTKFIITLKNLKP